MNDEIPQFCDYYCPFADFPPAETAGICRTMAAVQCRKLGELVNKNAPCEWRLREGDGKKRGRASKEVAPKKASGKTTKARKKAKKKVGGKRAKTPRAAKQKSRR